MFGSLIELWRWLPVRLRLQFLLIVALMTLGALLEMLSIGALLPVIAVMQSPETIATNPWLARLSAFAGNPGADSFFLLMLLALLAFFLVKNAYLVVLDILEYRIMATVQSLLSTRLMANYLGRPYAFHIEVNTAQLIRNVTVEVDKIYYYSLVPVVALISEVLVIAALFALVVSIDPQAALVLTFLGGVLVLSFFRIFRDRMTQIGTHLQDSSGKMIQYAQEGLGGVKEIKVMGREAFFEKAFASHAGLYARALRRAMVIHNFPIHLLESIFVAIFVALLVFLTWIGKASNVVPLMGVYAAAAFRLIPSFNRIMTATGRIRQSSDSLGMIVAEFAMLVPAATSTAAPGSFAFSKEIRVQNLSYSYPGAEREALCGVSLSIARGEMVGLVGRSGSGKTTLVDCILGLLEPSAGDVRVDGEPVLERLSEWRSRIGYIPQDIYLTDDSLCKNVALGLDEHEIDYERLSRALEAAQLADFVHELPAGVNSPIGERGVRLSGGQRQRIGIARAMYHDPDVLILDEATSALDTETERAIVHTIAGLKGRKTVLVIAHRLSTIEDCDRVFVLEKGELAESSAFREDVAGGDA